MNSKFSLIDICRQANIYLSDANISNEDADACINRVQKLVCCYHRSSLMLHCTDSIEMLTKYFGFKHLFMPEYFWIQLQQIDSYIVDQFRIPKLTKLRSEI